MTTTRSLLCERLTAAWMLLNLQRLKKARFCRFSRLAFRADSLRLPCDGRSTQPFRWALSIDLMARLSDPRRHTTRVSPRAFAFSAEPSVRTRGTFPPATGLTLVSAAGSGQYELRSTCP